uniref:Uncharacterized protein n=1 Tax=Oryctolagus cuniculus TaxID=9986 RepID=A0A5F9DGA0_RABIT
VIRDVQFTLFTERLCMSLFLLVVLYHHLALNNPKKQELDVVLCSGFQDIIFGGVKNKNEGSEFTF